MNWSRLFIRVNNRMARWRARGVSPAHVLLLLPRCLHKDSCSQNVTRNLDECRRCGQCSLAELSRLRADLGVVACVVGGGRQAVEYVRGKGIRAVVAVACEKELVHGIRAAFPKPVLAIENSTPEGPCRNTLVDPREVAEAIASLTGGQSVRGE
jgi:hypothetical protein